MELSSGHTDTLNLSSADGTATTITSSLSGNADESALRSDQFSRMLESELPESPPVAEPGTDPAQSTPELEQSQLTQSTFGKNPTDVEPIAVIKATLSADTPAHIVHSDVQEKSVIPELSVNSPAADPSAITATSTIHEEAKADVVDQTMIEAASGHEAESLIPATAELAGERKLANPILVAEGRTTPHLTPTEGKPTGVNNTPVSGNIPVQPVFTPVAQQVVAGQAGFNGVAAESIAPVSLSYSQASVADVETAALTSAKAGGAGAEPLVSSVVATKSDVAITGVAGELLKDSPGVVSSRIGNNTLHNPALMPNGVATGKTEMPSTTVSAQPGLPAQVVPAASQLAPMPGGWQQLEAVGRMRTQLNQQATPLTATTTAIVHGDRKVAPETPVTAGSVAVSTTAAQPLDPEAQITTVNPTTPVVSADAMSAEPAALEPGANAGTDKVVPNTAAVSLNPMVSTDTRPGAISAGEFMIAQSVAPVGATALSSTSLEGMPRLTGTLDLHEPAMATKLGGQVRIMADGGIQSATLQVKPADLGPIQISVISENDKLTVNIMASSLVTRDLLDTALPRLREQLSQGQFSQVDVNVSEQGKGQQQHNAGNDQNASHYQAEQEVARQEEQEQIDTATVSDRENSQIDSVTAARASVVPNGRIDAYI